MSEETRTQVEYSVSHCLNLTLHIYIDIAGDLIAGTLLSQILYWFSPDKNGRQKVRVQKKGEYWLAKRREDWWDEIRISPKQYDRAIKILKEKELVRVKLFKFDGSPVVHIQPIYENINAAMDEWKEREAAKLEDSPIFPKGKNGNSPKVKMEIDERVKTLTETTTDIKEQRLLYKEYIECAVENGTLEGEELKSDEIKEEVWHWKSERDYESYINSALPRMIRSIANGYEDKNKAYDVFLRLVQGYFKRYRRTLGKLHPWYKKELILKAINNLFESFGGTISLDDIKEREDLFFSHKSMRGYELLVFANPTIQKWLEAEEIGDYSDLRADAV